MKKILLAVALCVCGAVSAEEIVLDLANPNNPVNYDENGVWTNVYKDDMISSQQFVFSHGVTSAISFYGFVPSKSTTITASAGTDDQFGCMAKGGYAGEGTPFFVSYWDTYTETTQDLHSCEAFTPSSYYAVGCYVCNSPYVYYTIQQGNAYSKKFEQGDWFKLIVHGLDEFDTEVGTVEYYLADYRSQNPEEWKLNNSWEWIDLSSLGRVMTIYFSLESSDTGKWGMNTPAYFCLDRLTVSTDKPSAIEETAVATVKAYYDRANSQIRVESANPVEVAVYNMNGALVMNRYVDGTASIDMSVYPSGVYVVRCGGYSVKIVK